MKEESKRGGNYWNVTRARILQEPKTSICRTQNIKEQ